MSIWNDISWVEGIRTPFLNYFFYNISLTGYPIFLFLFLAFGYFFWSPQRFSRVAMLLFISAVINSFSNGRLLNSDEIVNQVASFHKTKIFQLRALKKIYKKVFGKN